LICVDGYIVGRFGFGVLREGSPAADGHIR